MGNSKLHEKKSNKHIYITSKKAAEKPPFFVI